MTVNLTYRMRGIKGSLMAGKLWYCEMTENELLTELLKELTLPDIAPDEVTAVMLSESLNCSWSKAAAVLKTKLAAGELTSRQVRTANGKPATAYRKVG